MYLIAYTGTGMGSYAVEIENISHMQFSEVEELGRQHGLRVLKLNDMRDEYRPYWICESTEKFIAEILRFQSLKCRIIWLEENNAH